MKTLCVLISLAGYAPVDNDLHLYISGKHAQLFYKNEHIVAVDDAGCVRADVDGVELIQYDAPFPFGLVTVKPDVRDGR